MPVRICARCNKKEFVRLNPKQSIYCYQCGKFRSQQRSDSKKIKCYWCGRIFVDLKSHILKEHPGKKIVAMRIREYKNGKTTTNKTY